MRVKIKGYEKIEGKGEEAVLKLVKDFEEGFELGKYFEACPSEELISAREIIWDIYKMAAGMENRDIDDMIHEIINKEGKLYEWVDKYNYS